MYPIKWQPPKFETWNPILPTSTLLQNNSGLSKNYEKFILTLLTVVSQIYT